MRLPSLDELRVNSTEAFRRFPYTITAGLLSALLVIAEAENFVDVFGFLTRSGNGLDLLVATTLALPLMFALRVGEERGVLSGLAANLVRVAGVAALGYVVWRWPDWSEKLRALHYVQISLGLHLLAAFLPFVRAGELNGFWQYNRSLLLRFLIGGVFSGVLFAGLAIAIAAIEQLFGVDVPGEPYMDLLGIVAFGFQTWFFTAGVPRNLAALDELADYPPIIKVFAQYVLVPLVTVYLAILTAYLGRVLITTEWPSGWIGWLVSSVSVAGILAILLTHPIRGRDENRWIVTYGRWFWIALLPSIGMLFAAIWKRVDQYGITEPRYFLFVLTVWLTAMAVLYGFARSQNIKWLPITLCAVAFVTLVGPWSAYAVSRSSQLNRLEDLLERNGLVEEGRAIAASARSGATASDTIAADDRRQIGAALTYLYEHHGGEPLVPLLGEELAATDSIGGMDPVRSWIARDRAVDAMAALDMQFVDVRPAFDAGGQFHLRTDPGEAIEIGGYQYVIEAGRNGTALLGGRELTFRVEDNALVVRTDRMGEGPGQSTEIGLLTVPLTDAVQRGIEYIQTPAAGPDNQVPRTLMRMQASGEGIEAAFLPTWVSGRRIGDRLEIDAVNGVWLFNLGPEFGGP